MDAKKVLVLKLYFALSIIFYCHFPRCKVELMSYWHHRNVHTSTLEARKTQVGAMSTGSILFKEYLQNKKQSTPELNDKFNFKLQLLSFTTSLPGIEAFEVYSCSSNDLLSQFQMFP